MELTGNVFSFPWEASLMEWLQTHLSGAVPVISFFSAFGEELVMILIIGFLYWWYDKKAGKAIGLSVLMGITWNPLIKNIFLRRRPYFDHEGIRILRLMEPKADPMDIAAQGFSFPSGHSTNAVTMYGSLGQYFKKKWLTAAALALPLLVGFSRVVVGAHYPTDVFVGWLLGVAVLLLDGTPRLLLLQKRGLFHRRGTDDRLYGGQPAGGQEGSLCQHPLRALRSAAAGGRIGGVFRGEFPAESAFLQSVPGWRNHRRIAGSFRQIRGHRVPGVRRVPDGVCQGGGFAVPE